MEADHALVQILRCDRSKWGATTSATACIAFTE
jgi:hypothetical protein